MSYKLTGGQMRTANKRLAEIMRQLGREEYSHDPLKLLAALQSIIEGKFSMPTLSESVRKHIPENWTIREDVPAKLESIDQLGFVSLGYNSDKKENMLVTGESAYVRGIMEGALGLSDAVFVLDHEGKISEAQEAIIFPCTILCDPDGGWHIPWLLKTGGRWKLDFEPIAEDWGPSSELAVCKSDK